MPDFEGEASFEIGAGLLKQLVGQTLFSAAKESTRYAFNGVLMVAKGKKISLISTDGRRLAMAKGDLISDKLGKDGGKAIVPAKALNLLDKLLHDAEETIGGPDPGKPGDLSQPQCDTDQQSGGRTIPTVRRRHSQGLRQDDDRGNGRLPGAIRRAALLTTEDSKGVRMAFTKKGLNIDQPLSRGRRGDDQFPVQI